MAGGSFTVTGAQDMIGWLMEAIEAKADFNFQLLDEGGGVVKQGRLTAVSGVVSDNNVMVSVRIVDSSEQSYTFKYLKVYALWDSTPHVVIYHTFGATYNKGSAQTLDCIVRTGIANCVAG